MKIDVKFSEIISHLKRAFRYCLIEYANLLDKLFKSNSIERMLIHYANK